MAFLLLALVYISLHVWPFGDNSVLTGDLNGQYINYYAHFQRALHGDAGFAYGFDKSLGGGLTGLFAYYSASLFSFLYLLVPPVFFAKISGLVLAVKAICSASFFCYFITRKYKNLSLLALPLSLCYAFMAYLFVYAQNVMWLDAIVLLPLICHGIDSLLETKRLTFFTVSLALCIFSNFYIGFMVCLFSCLYFAYGLFLLRHTEVRFFLSRCGVFALGGILAGAVNAVLLLPALQNINESKGIGLAGGALSSAFSLLFSPLTLFVQLFAGSFAIEDAEAGLPNLYCGVFVLACVLLFFLCKDIPRREKAGALVFLGVMVLSLCLSGLNLLWHGTKEPVWFLYRNSFLLSFLPVLFAARALSCNVIPIKKAAAACALLLGLSAVALFTPTTSLNRPYLLLSLITGAVAFGLAAWFFAAKTQRQKALALTVCCCVVCGELWLNTRDVLRRFEPYPCSEYEAFYTTGTEAVNAVKATDTGNYRMAQSFFRSLCDPMLLGYNGVAHFSSTQDENSVALLQKLGYDNFGGSNYYGAGSTAAADALLGVKYLFTRPGSYLPPAHFTPVDFSPISQDTQNEAWQIYENTDALPLAFFAHSDTATRLSETGNTGSTDGAHVSFDPFAYQNTLFAALTGETASDLFTPIHADKAYRNNRLEYTFAAEQPGLYYAKLAKLAKLAKPEKPNEKTLEFGPLPLAVNDTPLGSYFENTGFKSVINLGRYSAGQKGTLTLSCLQQQAESIDSALFYRLDTTRLERAVTALRQDAPQLQMRNGNLSLQITPADTARTLVLTVPWAPQWKAMVDGKPASLDAALAHFICIAIPAGASAVTLTFVLPALAIGAVISLLALLAIGFVFLMQGKNC